MQLPELFRSYLLKKGISKVSAKNYVSDVNKFLNWFNANFKRTFSIDDFSSDLVALYIKLKGGVITAEEVQNGLSEWEVVSSVASTRSFERYTSSLRRFAKFLTDEGLIETNPFDFIQEQSQAETVINTDSWHLKDFKNYLYEDGVSAITIKNYMVDIRAFTTWLEETGRGSDIESGTVSLAQVEEYKERLLTTLSLSASTINRKLSSIRKYLNYAVKYGFLHDLNTEQIESLSDNSEAPAHGLNLDDLKAHEDENSDRSALPPVRLATALLAPYVALEDAAASKIATNIRQKQLEDKIKTSNSEPAASVSNLSKEFYAPREISTKNFTPRQKLLHNLKHTRPSWYHKYHSMRIATYIHLGILVVYASVVGIMLNHQLFGGTNNPALAQFVSPNKLLSFKGVLTDRDGKPINSPTEVRFLIYNDPQASGAGHMLWQEVNTVKPNDKGEFVQELGISTPIDANILDKGNIYIGLSIGQSDELSPRKEIAQTNFAANAETLSGMLPITDSDAGNKNVILALDSSGNLTIGGNTSPLFQATGGEFALSGVGVSIETQLDSNANIRLAPDGFGRISLEKALINNSDTGQIVPGGVEINDRFGVLATESAVAAFVVNNNTTGGDIFTASSSGTTRFTIGNNGDLSLQPNAAIDTIDFGSISIGNTRATNISLGRYGQQITLPGYTAANGVLFTAYGTGILSQTTTNTANQCLVSNSNGSPTWSDCQGNWQVKDGTIQPANLTNDVLIGGESTTSAKFAFFNVNRGIPTASVAGNLTIMPRYNDNDGGRLGIGTTTPEFQLDIKTTQGQAGIRIADEDGVCTFNPTSSAKEWICSSDARLKTNIEDAQDALDDLAQFRIRDYTIKSSGERVTGVIAQEVQINNPSLVQKDSSGYLMVQTPSIWKLVAAIQELYEKTKVVDTLASLTSSLISSEENLREYIYNVTQAGLNTNSITSPLASIDELRTNVVSPLGGNKIKVAGNIQVEGNATVSGTLSATDATISGTLTANDATISGTLYADNIQANSIAGLDDKIASVASNLFANSQQASPAAQVTPTDIQSGQFATNIEFMDVNNLSASFATFRDGLIALGPATFNQATAIESFSVGTTLSISPNSIDTLGQDLEIQPLKQGAVSFLAGAVRIEKDGSLKVKGNATFAGNVAIKGKLKTNVISPVGKGDLSVQNSSGSAILSVNQRGDLQASGAATVSKLNIALVAPAYAISDTEVVATGSAGTATLKKYTKELTIDNPNVTEKSLIYITPVGGTSNQVLYLLRQVAQESFTVGLDTPTLLDRQFNWIIVN